MPFLAIDDKVKAALCHSGARAASFVYPLHKSSKILRDTVAKLNKPKAKTALIRKLDQETSHQEPRQACPSCESVKLVQFKLKRACVLKALIMRRLLDDPGKVVCRYRYCILASIPRGCAIPMP